MKIDKNQNQIKDEKDADKIDIFDAPTPGQSLTDAPGKWDWEKPAQTDTPDEALTLLVSRINEPDVTRDLLDLLYAGVTIESIVKSIVFVGFTQGLFTPDIAEIAKIYLFFHVRAMARKAGIRPRLFNTNDMEEINIADIMSTLKPEESERLINTTKKIKDAKKVTGTFMDLKNETLKGGK